MQCLKTMKDSVLNNIAVIKSLETSYYVVFPESNHNGILFKSRKGILRTRCSMVQAPFRSRFKSSAQPIKEVHLQLEFCEIFPRFIDGCIYSFPCSVAGSD